MIKIGEYVYYKFIKENKLSVGSGLIINITEDSVCILEARNWSSCYLTTKIKSEDIVLIENRDDLVAEINYFYDEKIKMQESQLKSVKRADYKENIKKEYLLLKEEILNTCANMNKEIDDYEFENKLKAICQKKKQLFSIRCEEMNDARKFNGEIKYNISEMINERDNVLRNLDYSMKVINETLSK